MISFHIEQKAELKKKLETLSRNFMKRKFLNLEFGLKIYSREI